MEISVVPSLISVLFRGGRNGEIHDLPIRVVSRLAPDQERDHTTKRRAPRSRKRFPLIVQPICNFEVNRSLTSSGLFVIRFLVGTRGEYL
jgi:hypothetical protein